MEASEKFFKAAELMNECSEIMKELGEISVKVENDEELPEDTESKMEGLLGRYIIKAMAVQKIQL